MRYGWILCHNLLQIYGFYSQIVRYQENLRILLCAQVSSNEAACFCIGGRLTLLMNKLNYGHRLNVLLCKCGWLAVPQLAPAEEYFYGFGLAV